MSGARVALRVLMLGLAAIILMLAGWRLTMKRRLAVVPHNLEAVSVYGTVTPFELTDQRGRVVTLADLKGKVWVADFIFTRCMGPCPLISKSMSGLHEEFKAKAGLRFVSFSVDPEFDTPNILKNYADGFGADHDRWRFLTGPRPEIVRLARDVFKLAVGAPSEQDGVIDILHSLNFMLVDEQARIVGVFDSTDNAAVERLRTELRRLP